MYGFLLFCHNKRSSYDLDFTIEEPLQLHIYRKSFTLPLMPSPFNYHRSSEFTEKISHLRIAQNNHSKRAAACVTALLSFTSSRQSISVIYPFISLSESCVSCKGVSSSETVIPIYAAIFCSVLNLGFIRFRSIRLSDAI